MSTTLSQHVIPNFVVPSIRWILFSYRQLHFIKATTTIIIACDLEPASANTIITISSKATDYGYGFRPIQSHPLQPFCCKSCVRFTEVFNLQLGFHVKLGFLLPIDLLIPKCSLLILNSAYFIWRRMMWINSNAPFYRLRHSITILMNFSCN